MKNLATFFCSSLSLSISLFIAFTLVSPPPGCYPTPFYLSDLVSPLFLVNLPTKFFSFGCHPLEGVTRGGPPPPLVTPLPVFDWVNCGDVTLSRCRRTTVCASRCSETATTVYLVCQSHGQAMLATVSVWLSIWSAQSGTPSHPVHLHIQAFGVTLAHSEPLIVPWIAVKE